MRPWAVSVRASRRSSWRVRMLYATWSMTSAALPPASRCRRATSATCSRSRLCMRVTHEPSASSSGTPRRSSEMTRESSSCDGSGALSATTASAPGRLWPARSDWASTSRLSESWSPNARRLRSTFDVTNIRRKIGPVNASSRKIGAFPITARIRPTNSAIMIERKTSASGDILIPARATSSAKPRMSRLRWNEVSASARAARISSRRMPVSSSSSKSTNDDIRLRKLRPRSEKSFETA